MRLLTGQIRVGLAARPRRSCSAAVPVTYPGMAGRLGYDTGGGLAQMDLVLAAIESSGGLEYTARLAQAEADQAYAALAALPATPYRDGLAALARFAIERKH